MDISVIIFFLGLSPQNNSYFLKEQWNKLENHQKFMLIKQFEREYQISLNNSNTLSEDTIRKVYFRAFDMME